MFKKNGKVNDNKESKIDKSIMHNINIKKIINK